MNTTDVKKFKILHFEDDEFLAELFKVVFEREGLEYINYDNPTKDPASIVVKEKPDIVIMDFMMPGMDGFAATEILKKDSRTKNIPIFFLGNLSQKEEVERGISLGATDYLICSQLTPSETMRLIKKYLEDPSHYQPWYLNWLNKKELQKDESSKIEIKKELDKIVRGQSEKEFVEIIMIILSSWRTPLTVIKGYSELLKEGEYKGKEEIVYKNISKTINIIVDNYYTLYDFIIKYHEEKIENRKNEN